MTVIARDEYEAVLGERNYALGELRELRQVVAERNAEVERLTRQLAGAVDALREYGGHREDCNALSGAPDCSCGFDDAMLRALGRAGV